MTRCCRRRRIGSRPKVYFYKPGGVPIHFLDIVVLKEDEMEALRLADDMGLYHEDAAKQMEVSRQTFGNIIRSARSKVASALLHGKAIEIECSGLYSEKNLDWQNHSIDSVDSKEI
jgi:uncharacterized protein